MTEAERKHLEQWIEKAEHYLIAKNFPELITSIY
jgi:hypothetical protein